MKYLLLITCLTSSSFLFSNPDEARRLAERASGAMEDGDVESAMDMWAQAVSLDPTIAGAFPLLASTTQILPKGGSAFAYLGGIIRKLVGRKNSRDAARRLGAAYKERVGKHRTVSGFLSQFVSGLQLPVRRAAVDSANMHLPMGWQISAAQQRGGQRTPFVLSGDSQLDPVLWSQIQAALAAGSTTGARASTGSNQDAQSTRALNSTDSGEDSDEDHTR
ncbi:MAG: hypothetical protein V4534_01950 [Myxococcota bacterium]